MPTLQAFHHRKKKSKLTLELDHDLAEQLKAYGAYYKDAHGADVTPQELLTEVARQFFAQDQDFQKSRKTVARESKVATVPAAA